MAEWIRYAIIAALLYGLHQVFTKLAADKIGAGLGALVVEGVATLTIVIYLLAMWGLGYGSQKVTTAGVGYSVATGICVGIGPVAFFLLFRKGGPLSVVPGILAGGMVIVAAVGMTLFREPVSATRLLGVALSVTGLILLRR